MIPQKTKKNISKFLSALTVGVVSLTSCQENIDTSDLYTFTGETATSFLSSVDSMSYYVELLNTVKQSSKTSSTVASLLSARGNYTCFAPTNEAISNYLDTLYQETKIESNDFVSFIDSVKSNSHVYDSIAEVIVFNSVIDCGSSDAYETAVFPSDGGTFTLPNMNDRYLTASTTAISGQKNTYYVQGDSKIESPDNEVENGYVHFVSKVIAPSNATVYELLGDIEDMQIFSELIQKTGWSDSLTKYLDEDYEETYTSYLSGTTVPERTDGQYNIFMPEHRKYGFTIFAETDDIFNEAFQNAHITSGTNIEKLATYLETVYGMNESFKGLTYGTSDEDLKKPDNAINRFVSYHLLPVSLPSNQLVIHFNEYGYDLSAAKQGVQTNISVPVYEFYETMNAKGMRRRLLKISESKNSDGIRLNRKMQMDPSSYEEILGAADNVEGISVDRNNEKGYVTNALNGYIYPIKSMLVYDDNVVNNVLNDRIRFDVASLMWEMINLGYRRPMGLYPNSMESLYFPNEFKMTNIESQDGTQFYYLAGWNANGYANYQGDEVNIIGNYDVTIKLPPVPSSGTYEVRYGYGAFPSRGMAQIYFGEKGNGKVPQPAGIPIDLTQYGEVYGWQANPDYDQDLATEITKNLRNKDHMLATRYTNYWGSGYTLDQRPQGASMRRIIYRGNMDPDKEYYIRIKSVLDDTSKQLYIDYMELVPRNIYDNPTTTEDAW